MCGKLSGPSPETRKKNWATVQKLLSGEWAQHQNQFLETMDVNTEFIDVGLSSAHCVTYIINVITISNVVNNRESLSSVRNPNPHHFWHDHLDNLWQFPFDKLAQPANVNILTLWLIKYSKGLYNTLW
jgi:hypothetical protein